MWYIFQSLWPVILILFTIKLVMCKHSRDNISTMSLPLYCILTIMIVDQEMGCGDMGCLIYLEQWGNGGQSIFCSPQYIDVIDVQIFFLLACPKTTLPPTTSSSTIVLSIWVKYCYGCRFPFLRIKYINYVAIQDDRIRVVKRYHTQNTTINKGVLHSSNPGIEWLLNRTMQVLHTPPSRLYINHWIHVNTSRVSSIVNEEWLSDSWTYLYGKGCHFTYFYPFIGSVSVP